MICLALCLAGGRARAQVPDLMTGGFFVGVNYPGLDSWFGGDGHVAGVNYSTPAETDFDYFASRGIRIIRLPFRWEHLLPSAPDGAINPAYLEDLRRVVASAHARRMGVILDMHNYGVYRGRGYNEKADIGRPGAPTADQLASAWGKIAAATKDWPGLVGFDTMNEPVAVPDLAGMQQKAVDAIRGAGAAQPIAIEGNHYSTAGTWVTDGNEVLYTVRDPLDRLIIEAHVYPDCDSSGTHSRWATQSTDPSRDKEGGTGCGAHQAVTTGTGAARVAVFLASARAHGKRIWLGEIGAAADQPWRLAIDNVLEAVRGAGGFVTYWSAGAGYGSYGYTVQPQPPGQQPGSVVDTPMMANVTKYTGFTAIPYALSGPRSGPAGGASAPFTLTVHGFLQRPVTVTPTDGGAGGRFDPPRITIPAGFNGSADGMAEASLHVTYTAPVRPGVMSIGATNDGSLVDPAPQGYATRPNALAASRLTPIAIFSDHAIDPAQIDTTLTLRLLRAAQPVGYAPSKDTGQLDAAALKRDAGSGPMRLDSLRNAAGHGGALALASASPTYPAPGPADLPVFVPSLSELGGRPGWRVERSRLQAPVDLGGQAQACVFVVGKPARPGHLLSWVSPAGDTAWVFPGGTGSWDLRLDAGPVVTLGPPIDTVRAHAYAMCFDRGAMSLFVDGAKTATATAPAASLPMHDARQGRGLPPVMNVGFYPSYNDAAGTGYAAGLLRDIVVTTGPWTDDGVTILLRSLAGDAGLTAQPGPASPAAPPSRRMLP